MSGWVKLYRQSMQSAVFWNANLWQVWTWCLMKASYGDRNFPFNGKQMSLAPGQFVSGRIVGAAECHMNQSTFWKQINVLKSLGNIDTKCNNRYTVFTLIKWADYQEEGSIVTAKRQPDDSQMTAREQPDDSQMTHTRKEERKKGRKETTAKAPSDVPLALSYFGEKFTERTGAIYMASFAVDGKHFKDMLTVYPIDKIRSMIDIFFKSKEEFIIKAGFTVGVFYSQRNKLIAQVSKPAPTAKKELTAAQEYYLSQEKAAQ